MIDTLEYRMAKKTVAKDINGLDPNTGELVFTFEEVDDGKPETPNNTAAAVQDFSRGDAETAMKRYKAVQGWATKVHQQNLAMQRRLDALERGVSSREETRLPTANDPGQPNLDTVLSDPAAFKQFIVEAIQSQFGIVGKYVQEQLKPYRPVLTAYQTHNELQTAVSKYPDFVHWQPEMLKISNDLPGDTEMTLEELYLEARSRNPEKAFKLDSGDFDTTNNQTADNNAENKQNTQGQQSETTASGTETQVPDTSTTPAKTAAPYNPLMPSKEDSPFMTATAEELKSLAARTTTETGVADGSSPEQTHQGLDAAMEAAWSEVVSG